MQIREGAIRGTGRAVIKVSVPESGIYSSASKNITVNAAPKRPSFSIKNIKGKKLRISWKKDKRPSGYEICTASNSEFKNQKVNFVWILISYEILITLILWDSMKEDRTKFLCEHPVIFSKITIKSIDFITA